jgi:NAD(P)-dependent dehydrogenase (short-subunit alcohol dehydrogenase family)
MAVRRILITGANKGIGLALVRSVLTADPTVHVLLGSRSAERGQAAVDSVLATSPEWETRLEVLPIDVSDEKSVASAAAHVASKYGRGPPPLYGVVNNAGVFSEHTFEPNADVNVLGVRRVCEAFLPLIQLEGGRLVNISSQAAPMTVAGCSKERQEQLCDPKARWSDVQALMDECTALKDDPEAFVAAGFKWYPYGLSKALVNLYTMVLGRDHPQLVINACHPGFIETDLSSVFRTRSGKSGKEIGQMPPETATKSPMHLLFGELKGSGGYYDQEGVSLAWTSGPVRTQRPGPSDFETKRCVPWLSI